MNTVTFQPSNRILVIDDNDAIHEDFRKILCNDQAGKAKIDSMMAAVFGSREKQDESAGFELDFADQGQKGLELVERAMAEARPYALVFVDIRMPPGWDGVETITHLWKCDPALQVVICSAYSDYSWHEIISKVGPSNQLIILKKPFDNVEVLQLAHAMTRKWALARQVAVKTAELQAANAELTLEVVQRKAAQEALLRSQERFAKSFNFNPLPIAIVRHADLVCADANSAFLECIGARSEDIIGRRLFDVAVVGDAALRGELEMGTPISSRECRLRTVSGGMKPARIWTERVDIEGQPHSLAIIEDLSAQQIVEVRLRQAQKMESVGQLAAGIAHDFNNLLTVIRGHASLRLASSALTPAVAESFQAVNDAAERAAIITRQLVAYGRKQVMQPKVIRLNGVFDDMEGMLRRLLPANIEIEYRLPGDLPSLYADVGNLEQVVMNLVVNAREAMPGGGKLTITAEAVTLDDAQSIDHPEARPGSFIRVTVEDTGAGIKESIRGKIFEPFFTTKPLGEGTGMGLAMSYGIIRQHNGWIDVASEPGKGAAFHIYIPVDHRLEQESATPAISSVKLEPEAAGAVRNVLILEDDPALREFVSTVLADGGYHVIEAPDGVTGLEVSRAFEGQIHLLLADMVMPGGLSGKDVAERLAPERPGMKVILSSGYSFGLLGADMQLLPGQNYLAKPYLTRELIEAVGRCFEDSPPAMAC